MGVVSRTLKIKIENTLSQSGAALWTRQNSAPRVVSIDIFRGLNVLLMIFVDNLGLVVGLPLWTNHMPRDMNGMTYVDMVFPAFLFLMGMSIPLSLDARLARDEGNTGVWMHVIARSMMLVVMGLFVANAPQVNARYTGLSEPWWAGLGIVAIALVLLRWPGADRYKRLFVVFRYAGLALLVLLFVIFRRATAQDEKAWLDFSDWEILGLLGWAYLLACTLYLLLGKRIAVLLGAFAALIAVNAFSVAGYLRLIENWPPFFKPFEAGLASLTVAGVLAALVIFDGKIGRELCCKSEMDLDSGGAGVDRGLGPTSAGHFENTRHANMVPVLHRGELGNRARAILDRGHEGLETVVEVHSADRAKRIAGIFPSLCGIPAA